jgi:acetyl esterase/lipase
LDAGFWTAMKCRPKWLRDTLSVILSIAFLFFPDEADDIVRRYRAANTVELMRCGWEKSTHPLLRALTYPFRSGLGVLKDIIIQRPSGSPSSFQPPPSKDIKARLYFSGTMDQMKQCSELIFQCHGGGFVSMNPQCHEDYVCAWAKKTGIPIVSIDYGKAPEHPYPWALEECFDAYRAVAQSNGSILGIQRPANAPPLKIVLVGDSA